MHGRRVADRIAVKICYINKKHMGKIYFYAKIVYYK